MKQSIRGSFLLLFCFGKKRPAYFIYSALEKSVLRILFTLLWKKASCVFYLLCFGKKHPAYFIYSALEKSILRTEWRFDVY